MLFFFSSFYSNKTYNVQCGENLHFNVPRAIRFRQKWKNCVFIILSNFVTANGVTNGRLSRTWTSLIFSDYYFSVQFSCREFFFFPTFVHVLYARERDNVRLLFYVVIVEKKKWDSVRIFFHSNSFLDERLKYEKCNFDGIIINCFRIDIYN